MLTSNPAAQGPVSADILAQLRPVRYCVVALWVSYVIKSVLSSPVAHISDLTLAICGTYLLMNDEKLSGCYSGLLRTPLSFCGGGGLQCAVPFVFMGTISGLFGLFQFISLLTSGFWLLGFLGALYTAASGASTFAAIFGTFTVYQTLKDLISARPSENSFAVHPPQYVSLASTSQPAATTGAFAGSGQRLGEV